MEEYEIEKSPSIFATPNYGVQYSVNVSQVFGSPHTFDEVIHLLSVATHEDIINFNINSNGGDFYSLVALRNAIRQTEAQVYMNLLGMCASAGSALFLENTTTSNFENVKEANETYAEIVGANKTTVAPSDFFTQLDWFDAASSGIKIKGISVNRDTI